jgi:hypothetical protein
MQFCSSIFLSYRNKLPKPATIDLTEVRRLVYSCDNPGRALGMSDGFAPHARLGTIGNLHERV